MKKKEIARRLNRAVSDCTPDLFDRIVSSPVPYPTRRRPLPRLKILSPAARNAAFALAACFVLVAVGLFRFLPRGGASETIVMLDVNPSVSLTVDKNGKTVSCTAGNADAQKLIRNLDFSETDLDGAVQMLIERFADRGYLKRKQDSAMLVSVLNDDQKTARRLRGETVSQIRESVLRVKSKVKVLSQTLHSDASRKEKAQSYSISEGKAAFIQKITERDKTLSFKKLSKMTIREIDRLTEKKKIEIGDTVEVEQVDYRQDAADGTESEPTDSALSSEPTEPPEETGLGSAACKAIALTDAGVESDAAERVQILLNHENGAVYEIEFSADGVRYAYLVRADTGEILHRESRPDDAPPQGDTSSAQTADGSSDSAATSSETASAEPRRISPYRARLIAASQAGVQPDADFQPSVQLVDQRYYVVEFELDGVPYIYEIDAYTGALME